MIFPEYSCFRDFVAGLRGGLAEDFTHLATEQGKNRLLGIKERSGGMKQRIRVVGLIEKEEGVLLLKKKAGRSDSPVFWELVTGKILFGEQPEETMVRATLEGLGVGVKSVELVDAVTFLGAVNSSRMANLYIVYKVRIKDGAKIKLGERYSAYRYLKKSELFKLRLDDAARAVLGMNEENEELSEEFKVNYRETANGATIYVDGSSRGNPGPSGIGYYIVGENGEVLKRGGEFIGFATSRVAEYYALKEGIEQAIELGLKSVRFVSDSLMMVNQMNGVYKVKNRDLLNIYADVRRLVAGNFEAVSFVYTERERNYAANREANLAIDRHFDMDVIK